MLPVNWLKDTLRARRAGNMLLFVGSGPLHATAHRLQRLRMCAPKKRLLLSAPHVQDDPAASSLQTVSVVDNV